MTKKILFNGHDFKFLRPVISHFQNDPGYEVLIDEHPGHVITDTRKSAEMLRQANILFCEWALGNAEWYSAHKKRRQTLIVRLHRQEIDLDYLNRIQWNNVDHIIFIAEGPKKAFLERFPSMAERASIIYNPIDCLALDREKMAGAEFNLGMIGTSPKRKAPHLALEMFLQLKKIDSRYTLFFKGKQPWEYEWLWRKPEERRYYEDFFRRLQQSGYANSVVFDPHGNDIPEWFTKIGFILSTSESEGSHQAVAEGMATGAIPVIRNWDGAGLLYPDRFVFSSVDEAVNLINKWKANEQYTKQTAAVKAYARENFDLIRILSQYEQLFNNLVQSKSVGSLAARPAVEESSASGSNGGSNGEKLVVMHICYISPGTQSGYVTRVLEETALLRKAGVEVVIACFVPEHYFSSMDELAEHLEFLRTQTDAHVHLISTDTFFDLSGMLRGNREIVNAIIEIGKFYNVDIVHGQALASALYALRANEEVNAKIVFDVHGISPEEAEMHNAHPARVNALAKWETELMQAADLNIFVSSRMKTYFETKYGLVDLQHVVIPCCVHSNRFEMSEEERLRKRKEKGISNRFVFLYLGTLSVWQWPAAMFSLFAHIYKERPDCLFYLLIPRADHDRALEWLTKFDLPEESYILEEVSHSEVGSRVGIADAGFLLREDHPVNYVSSPTKFGEYIAAGIPVIATSKIGDVSNIIQSEELGLVLQLTDEQLSSEELSKLVQFIDDVQKKRTEWSQRCTNYAKTNFDWASYGVRLLNAYKSLVADH